MKEKALLYLFIFLSITTVAQRAGRAVPERCGTMHRLDTRFEYNPELKVRFENRRAEFNRIVARGDHKLSSRAARGERDVNRTFAAIPVVFHIVSTNPNTIRDAEILAQLDSLNKNLFGSNADTTKIPSYFKSLFGRSGIQFCLAQRTPRGENTTGIERITTTKTSFSTNDNIKHASSGGADGWDSNNYFNVWVTTLADNVLGYATFPEDGDPSEQGVVIDFRTLPGGSFSRYNTGKTLTHETGHYFNLYHIWGDDDGGCSGTDYIDDTPDQSNSSPSCYSGIRTDNCTAGGNGIMYQNYMDYSTDACMVMFTQQQVVRMESALLEFRSSLLSSNGCDAPVTKNHDAQLQTVIEPTKRLCINSFTPVVTIRNLGRQNLTSLIISARIDNGSVSATAWKGALARLETANVTLNNLSTTNGTHTLTVYVTSPNDNPDEDVSTDTITVGFQYYDPVAAISESFEGTSFPPPGWDIVNPDNFVTWKRHTGNAKTGIASATINSFDYTNKGQKDDLRLPNITLTGIDSAFLSFNLAAAAYTSVSTVDNEWDTLEVLISTDCGKNYTGLYKKYGNSLLTRTGVTTNAFRPNSNDWRKDSVNLTDYIGNNNVILAFRNTNGYQNNIYLDDINLRTVRINPNLKRQGFLVTPNPTSGVIAVQFYPQPANLKAIQVYNLTGQKISEVVVNGNANNYYSINITNHAAGVYVVRAVFTDRSVTRKIVKF